MKSFKYNYSTMATPYAITVLECSLPHDVVLEIKTYLTLPFVHDIKPLDPTRKIKWRCVTGSFESDSMRTPSNRMAQEWYVRGCNKDLRSSLYPCNGLSQFDIFYRSNFLESYFILTGIEVFDWFSKCGLHISTLSSRCNSHTKDCIDCCFKCNNTYRAGNPLLLSPGSHDFKFAMQRNGIKGRNYISTKKEQFKVLYRI